MPDLLTPRSEHPDTPTTVVILGASGDLTRRKLVPALYMLRREKQLPTRFTLVGVARREKSDDQFREEMIEAVKTFARGGDYDEEELRQFASRMHYVHGELGDPDTYSRLRWRLGEVEEADNVPEAQRIRLFYLAIPPSEFPHALAQLSTSGLSSPEHADRTRIVIEKPFGHDTESARVLNKQVHAAFAEQQVYRIDHYLGKETVQNILVFRLANGIFEPLWNRRYIDHVQITVAETLGVENRASYFDQAGIMRDIVQNHMLQLLSLVGMEPPVRFNAEQVRNEKVKVLMALHPFSAKELETNVVRAQYVSGEVGGQRAPAYRDEDGVDVKSVTETYVGFKVYLDNWRWAGVPFYLRAGKRFATRTTSISIQFRQPPLALFRSQHSSDPTPNRLHIQVQPEEGIWLRIGSKRPGGKMEVDSVELQFKYATAFQKGPPDAYERLLLDAIHGDSTLFAREDEVDYAWRFCTPILEHWKRHKDTPLTFYSAGTWGPLEADRTMEADGRQWFNDTPGR